MTYIKALSILAVSLFAGLQAEALTPNIDLRDLVHYGPLEDRAVAQALVDQVRLAPTTFGLPPGINYPKQPLTMIGQFAISTIEVQNVTVSGYDMFLIYSSDKESWLNKVSIDNNTGVLGISKTDLTRNPPSVQIDILNRQMTMFERTSGFLKFAPVSLGSLVNLRLGDPNSGYRSLSSPFNRAVLSRSKSELSRQEPDYYRGRPFLRVVNLESSDFGGFTPFGLHYQISDTFERGFVSNGCFRLRDTDLYELSAMVFFSKKQGVPLSIVESTQNGNRHPYPLINTWFNMPRVIINEKGKPAFMTIEHGLFQFDKQLGQPEMLLRGQ